MFEDRQNDWLSQEMRREGYKNNNSMLVEDHEKHEQSRDWDAGAISNAKQHEEKHQKYNKIENNRKEISERQNLVLKEKVKEVFKYVILLYIYAVLKGIFLPDVTYLQSNSGISIILSIIPVILFILFIIKTVNLIKYVNEMEVFKYYD